MKIPKKIFYVWSVHDDSFYNVHSKNNSLKSDYIRVHILYECGGIYLDTDVQVLSNFDKFLKDDFFISLQHWKIDGKYCVEPAVMGCVKEHPFLAKVIKFYTKDFWNYEETNIPEIFKICLKKMYGFCGKPDEVLKSRYKGEVGSNFSIFPQEYFAQKLVKLRDITIYPEEYFCPKWMTSDDSIQAPGINGITNNTISIHWNNSSWLEYSSLEILNRLIKDKKKKVK